ncbi:IclR family transcriptional regulator [Virgibacillus phasianinus]|uniref:Glycerol operon regulatory protein n=1 Tax=Virgibacillus phasianinus TaxID=2017483 RepID=A0A220TZB5_9BACI|nr:IclR family transcriptional regulator [Virgibacillus phasianinus]ASK61105.1 IclR family transcriptional regulator [Virgibacillus phasianinus]
MNQSVIKALKLLDLFTEDIQELSLREVALRSDLPKPTAYRLLSALVESGFLQKTKDSDQDSRYRLGLKLLELGNLVSNQLEIREIALPLMEELAQDINEVIHIVIANQKEATYIEKVDSTRALRLYTRIGKSSPLYIGSGPKLLLAFMEKATREEILGDAVLYAIDENHTVDKKKLQKELQVIREEGYAYSIGEQDLETTGISYPLYNYRGQVIAALTVSGLSSHFEGDNLQVIKGKTRKTAERISGKLGYKSTI